MNLKDNADAANALANWFESQEISPTQACSVMILLLAASFVEAVREDHTVGKIELHDTIVELFDAHVKFLETRK